MAERTIKISYIKEADLLEISWDHQNGYMTGTEHDRILANVDAEGNLQGFQIHGVTRLGDDLVKITIPAPVKVK
jgi:hypothetical protein